MKVSKLMKRDVVTCGAYETADVAAHLMWDHDLGAIPVLNEHARLAGMVTDRDLFMAAYTRGEPLTSIIVATAMSTHLVTCSADCELAEVEALMRTHQIRRVPIVDDDGRMVGIISLSDIARAAQQGASVSPAELTSTVSAICAPRVMSNADPTLTTP